MIPVSILDLVRIRDGGDVRSALDAARDYAATAENLGFRRFWMAEHHNMPGIASAATSVAIAHVAAGTSTIRVGAGGIMLPNHSPLVIAEQFGTLASLHPGRIDLGLGRAPGGDGLVLRALRRGPDSADRFPQDVLELQALLAPAEPGQRLRAVPGVGSEVPLWILGSSLYGAQLAAAFGLPYAFASHFAPAALLPALAAYRDGFRPSAQLDRPHAMIGVNVIAADSDAEARRLFTTLQQAVVDILRGERGLAKPPVDGMDGRWTEGERAQVGNFLARSVVGGPETVRAGLAALVAETGADELMIVSDPFDYSARRRSAELIAEAAGALPMLAQAAE